MYEGSQSNISVNSQKCSEVTSKREKCSVQNRIRMIGESSGLPKRKQITMRLIQDVVMETVCEKQLAITMLPPKRMSAGWQI